MVGFVGSNVLLEFGGEESGGGVRRVEIDMATGQCERSGTRASAHPDPDPDSELRSSPQIPFQTPPLQTNECNISKITLRWVSVPYLFHTRCRPNNIFSAYSPRIICENQQESVIVPDSSDQVCDPEPPDETA